MRPVLSILAIFALCCAAEAAILPTWNHPDDNLTQPADSPAGDLSINSLAIDVSFADGPAADFITTGITFRGPAEKDEFIMDEKASDALRVSEPPPIETLLIGLLAFGAVGFWLARMRALTAIR